MKAFLMRLFKVGPGFGRRVVTIVWIEILTGLFLSLLIRANLGTDPITFTNLNIAAKLGLSFGNLQLLVNVLLFITVIVSSGARLIGPGTLANMIFIGYAADFGGWLWTQWAPQGLLLSLGARSVLFVIGLLGFLICFALYVNFNMGVSPYDAIPLILKNALPLIPATLIRIGWDLLTLSIGIVLARNIQLGPVILTFTLGPMGSLMGKFMRKAGLIAAVTEGV